MFSTNYQIIFKKIKINKKISKLLSVTFGAQTMIMPIAALKFNLLSFTFFISNLIVSPILGFIMIFGIITIFISFISINIASILGFVLDIALKGLIYIAKITSKIPFSNIIIKTPSVFFIIIIYFSIFILNYVFRIYISNNKRLFQRKIRKAINYKNIIRLIKIILICISILNVVLYAFKSTNKNLKIYFIDVGQGDCCLIVTPNNKKVLVDGGEGKTDILLPYLLDRRIKTIDYIIISHFDSDHCNGLIKVIENLKIENVIISNQAIFSDEYENIAKIINKKQINIINVKQGDKIEIEKNVQIDILYPINPLEYNDLNNNSIVAKLKYNNFSVLFTGDIENSEQNIINKYNNTNKLKSNILKISHHGSKTSSSEEFLKKVSPQIALIGVGQNNTFGHPSPNILKRLELINCKIYRTDINGEIKIIVNKKGKIWINKKFD